MPNPKLPAELKAKRGTLRPEERRVIESAPVIEGGYLKPFRPLEYAGLQLWDSVFKYGELWIARRTDTHLLLMTCEQLDRREQIKALIAETNDWHLFKQLNDLERLISSNLGLLGFTPSDRTRLGLAEVKAQSKLEELLARKGQRGNQVVAASVANADS
jgi:hypothetical protein